MKSPDLLDLFVDDSKNILVEWFDISEAEQLLAIEWQQVYAVGNLNGKIPLVFYENGSTNLPGGKTEHGESVEQTLARELREEINCRVLTWRPIGYQRLTEPGGNVVYQLRVYAELEKIGDFENDPGGSVVGCKLIDPADLNKEIGYGLVGERIMNILNANYIG